MKQKDIALIIVIVFVTGVVAYFLSNLVVGKPGNQQQDVETVEPISAEFTAADKKYFNVESVNPTQTITIGDTPNPQPFND